MSEQIQYTSIENAKFSKVIQSKLSQVSKLGTKENNDRLDGYEILNDLFLVQKVHEKVNVKLEDSVIKHYSSLFSLPILYRYHKAINAIQYSANFLEAVEAGKLPFSSFTEFGHTCIEAVQPKKNKPKKYILKITKNQLAELDKFVKKDSSGNIPNVIGTKFNEQMKSYFPSDTKPQKTDFEKLIESLETARKLSAKNHLTQAQRLEAQGIHAIIQAQLLPPKPIAKKKTVTKTIKKAA
jgi:hypothetical protein